VTQGQGYGYEPVKISTAEVVDEEREPLFYIDEVEYTIPKLIRPNITIRYLQNTLDEGHEYALAAAMREVLGEDAMEALAESDSVGEEQMRQIMDIVEGKLLAARKRQLGKSRGGRGR
jgi:hypothetical protein